MVKDYGEKTMNKIEIYTTQTCPYCMRAKKLLTSLGLAYEEHNVEDSFDEMCKNLSEKYNQPGIATVPQIIINGNYVGGYDNLEALYKSDRLKELLN